MSGWGNGYDQNELLKDNRMMKQVIDNLNDDLLKSQQQLQIKEQ
jgi:hypothetical protein